MLHVAAIEMSGGCGFSPIDIIKSAIAVSPPIAGDPSVGES